MRTAAIFLPLALSACGSLPTEELSPALATNRQSVIGGTLDDNHYTGVVGLISTSPSGSQMLCTGFVLTPSLVLTASHCASTSSPDGGHGCGTLQPDGGLQDGDTIGAAYGTGAISVTTETNLYSATGWSQNARTLLPPGAEGGVRCGQDIALVELSTPLQNVTPLPLRLDVAPIVGEGFTAVGYGNDGAQPVSDGVRRYLSNVSVEAVGVTYSSATGKLRSTPNDFVMNRGPCGGDSGGPAIDNYGNAVGVMSRGVPTVCTSMIYTSLLPFADWLRITVRTVSAQHGEPVPQWAQEPVVDAGVDDQNDAGSPTTTTEVIPAADQNPPGGCSAAPATPALIVAAAFALLSIRRSRHGKTAG